MGRVTWKTWDAFLEFLKQASAEKKNKKNIILSSEEFSSLHDMDVARLHSALKPWKKVGVVITLRRFYEWLPSVYNEIWKRGNTIPVPSFPQWTGTFINLNSLSMRNEIQASAVIWRGYKEYFDEIVVLDYHDEEIPIHIKRNCDTIPGSKRACDLAKAVNTEKS